MYQWFSAQYTCFAFATDPEYILLDVEFRAAVYLAR